MQAMRGRRAVELYHEIAPPIARRVPVEARARRIAVRVERAA
jgi:hypothetical protein